MLMDYIENKIRFLKSTKKKNKLKRMRTNTEIKTKWEDNFEFWIEKSEFQRDEREKREEKKSKKEKIDLYA